MLYQLSYFRKTAALFSAGALSLKRGAKVLLFLITARDCEDIFDPEVYFLPWAPPFERFILHFQVLGENFRQRAGCPVCRHQGGANPIASHRQYPVCRSSQYKTA